jgi:type I restriction enzyme S subunit
MVGEIATLADGPFGSNLKTSHYVATGPRVVRLQNIGDGVFHDERAHISQAHFEELSKHAVLPGDVVAASLGEEAPRACLIPESLGPAIVKADCIRVRPTAGVDPSWLMWALNAPPVKRQAAARIKGVGRPRLGLRGLRELMIPVPSFETQRAWSSALEEAFEAVRALDERLEVVRQRGDQFRRGLLASAFRGELAPQDPSDEPASVLLERVAAERAAAPKLARRRGEKLPI